MISIDILPEWEHAAEQILTLDLHKVLILGVSDSGKSTFCRFLCRYLAQKEKSVAMIDADIGQKVIGTPACITSGFPGETGMAASIDGTYFVGGVNPFGRFFRMIAGVSLLTNSTGADFKIIDTTGLVHGAGRALKESKIEALRPDLIIGIQRSIELELLLREHRNRRILRIPVSNRAVSRTREERSRAREAAFTAYFQSASEVSIGIEDVIIQRSRILNGTPMKNTGYMYCEDSAEGLLAVTAKQTPENQKLLVLKPGFEENLLCGVADADGAGLGIAIIKRIDFRKKIELITPVKANSMRILQFGDIYISTEGKALGAKKPNAF